MRNEVNNRMSTAEKRIEPTEPQPVQRELVQPPPEYKIKCPHCGAAGRMSKNVNHMGTIPITKESRRLCLGCGAKLAFSVDWKHVRVIG